MRNVDIVRPQANYQLVLYCNSNLKSLSAKDKAFTEQFQEACGKIPVEYLSDLPTIEKPTLIPNTKNSRGMIVADDFMDTCFKSPVIQQLFGRLETHTNLDCALLVQFSFSKEEFYESIFRSASAIILFRNPSDRQIVTDLNTKLFTKMSRKKRSDQFLQKALRR